MSTYSRERRKRRRKFRPFIQDSEIIGDSLVFQIHLIPEIIDYGQEFDFWVLDKKDLYLLTLEKNKNKEIHFQRLKPTESFYCRLQVEFDTVDIAKYLQLIKTIGIPYKLKGRLTRKLK